MEFVISFAGNWLYIEVLDNLKEFALMMHHLQYNSYNFFYPFYSYWDIWLKK